MPLEVVGFAEVRNNNDDNNNNYNNDEYNMARSQRQQPAESDLSQHRKAEP